MGRLYASSWLMKLGNADWFLTAPFSEASRPAWWPSMTSSMRSILDLECVSYFISSLEVIYIAGTIAKEQKKIYVNVGLQLHNHLNHNICKCPLRAAECYPIFR